MLIVDEVTLCVQASGLPVERVEELAAFARENNQPVVQVLVDKAKVDEHALLHGLAVKLSLPFADRNATQIPAEVLAQVSPALAMRHLMIPLSISGGRLQIACADPFDWRGWEDLSHVLGRPIERVLCPRATIRKLLKANYGVGADTVQRMLAARGDKVVEISGSKATALGSDEQAANDATVVNLVNQILTEAIRVNATDIHLEPHEDRFRVRYRIDGMLEDIAMPVSVNLLRQALISRVKIMSNLDITEKRLPQDGRCQVSLDGAQYDLRVGLLPGVHGEAVSIRLQSRQMVKLDLESLGFELNARNKIEQLIARPHGLILVTGPTGSGKTTTLYTCLNKINVSPMKIITIEDPVEYWMENILQMQVQEHIGFTFARALRGMLRHDPDIMLVGEIRDRETADIAIRSSLTGHLVFATLHTNDAASAFTRLLDIGIEPFLVASSVLGVVAQRLVRRVCPFCKQQVMLSAGTDAERGLLSGMAGARDATLYEGQLCDKCRFTGYRGRTSIAEVLMVTPGIRALIQQREPAERIKELAVREGMSTLRECAVSALCQGKTTVAEVMRVTQEEA